MRIRSPTEEMNRTEPFFLYREFPIDDGYAPLKLCVNPRTFLLNYLINYLTIPVGNCEFLAGFLPLFYGVTNVTFFMVSDSSDFPPLFYGVRKVRFFIV